MSNPETEMITISTSQKSVPIQLSLMKLLIGIMKYLVANLFEMYMMLAPIWGTLWTSMPNSFSVSKILSMVEALTKLHNSCIKENDQNDHDTFLELNMERKYSIDCNG